MVMELESGNITEKAIQDFIEKYFLLERNEDVTYTVEAMYIGNNLRIQQGNKDWSKTNQSVFYCDYKGCHQPINDKNGYIVDIKAHVIQHIKDNSEED